MEYLLLGLLLILYQLIKKLRSIHVTFEDDDGRDSTARLEADRRPEGDEEVKLLEPRKRRRRRR